MYSRIRVGIRSYHEHPHYMAIIDFKEIPDPYHSRPVGMKSATAKSAAKKKVPAKGNVLVASFSTDLDAFKKFASEFFAHVCGCKVIEAPSRGQDGGRDLVVEGELSDCVKGRFLVSCKHKASSGTSVNTDRDEPNVKGRLDACGGQFFIGFYSTVASAGLRRHLEDTRTNQEGFDFFLFNSADIESRLLSFDEPRGWLLAARHFPKSMGNLFRRFVVPINYYKASDVKQKGSMLQLDGPYGGKQSLTAATVAESKRFMAEQANDTLTSHIHTVFFCDALTDFIRLLPNAFVRLPDADPSNLRLEEVAPNYEAVGNDLDCGHRTTLRIVAAVWSFWDGQRAVAWLLDSTCTGSPRDLQLRSTAASLTIGQVSGICDGKYRDILARLIAFCPASLPTVPLQVLIMRNGKRLNLEKQLAADFKRIVSSLDTIQLKELARYNGECANENGWLQLIAILGSQHLVSLIDKAVATELQHPPVSLGKFEQPLNIGFDRTSYNSWLEKSLGLGATQASSDVPDAS